MHIGPCEGLEDTQGNDTRTTDANGNQGDCSLYLTAMGTVPSASLSQSQVGGEELVWAILQLYVGNLVFCLCITF